jgi:hypothetical protein
LKNRKLDFNEAKSLIKFHMQKQDIKMDHLDFELLKASRSTLDSMQSRNQLRHINFTYSQQRKSQYGEIIGRWNSNNRYDYLLFKFIIYFTLLIWICRFTLVSLLDFNRSPTIIALIPYCIYYKKELLSFIIMRERMRLNLFL